MDSAYNGGLSEVGLDGSFQIKFDLFYNCFLAFFWTMSYMNIILALTIIPHTCELPERPENVSEYSWKLKYIPVVNNDSTYVKFSSCLIYSNPYENNDTQDCNRYDYDTSWYGSTVTSENNWVCSQELNVAHVYAYSRLAEGVGSIIFGWFGDVYGRRWTFIISLACMIIGRIISIFGSQSFLVFVTGMSIASIPSWSVLQSTAVISTEISSPERRTTILTFKCAAWSLGMFVLPFLYWWIREWKPFMLATTIFLVPFFCHSWTIIESPRWLWLKGNNKSCVKILKQIAKENKNNLQLETEQEILAAQPRNLNIEVLGPLALFSSWQLTKNTILQLVFWFSVSISYTMLLFSSGEKKDGNPFLDFAWQAVAEFPGNLLGACLVDRIGRRYTGSLTFLVVTFMWFFKSLIENGNSLLSVWWLGDIIMFINRLSNVILYYAINLFNMELYPTSLRQSGMSLGSVISAGSSALAPYLIVLGHNVDSRLPGIILIGSSILGAFSSYYLPETLNQKLPETLQDARLFGKKKRKYLSDDESSLPL